MIYDFILHHNHVSYFIFHHSISFFITIMSHSSSQSRLIVRGAIVGILGGVIVTGSDFSQSVFYQSFPNMLVVIKIFDNKFEWRPILLILRCIYIYTYIYIYLHVLLYVILGYIHTHSLSLCGSTSVFAFATIGHGHSHGHDTFFNKLISFFKQQQEM